MVLCGSYLGFNVAFMFGFYVWFHVGSIVVLCGFYVASMLGSMWALFWGSMCVLIGV